MTDRPYDTNAKDPLPAQTTAPDGIPVPITPDNRSDANDGVARPLGFYSTQAQADRNAGRPGSTSKDKTAGGPGFYSPEQQHARTRGPSD